MGDGFIPDVTPPGTAPMPLATPPAAPVRPARAPASPPKLPGQKRGGHKVPTKKHPMASPMKGSR